jgi:hypothetical protein
VRGGVGVGVCAGGCVCVCVRVRSEKCSERKVRQQPRRARTRPFNRGQPGLNAHTHTHAHAQDEKELLAWWESPASFDEASGVWGDYLSAARRPHAPRLEEVLLLDQEARAAAAGASHDRIEGSEGGV